MTPQPVPAALALARDVTAGRMSTAEYTTRAALDQIIGATRHPIDDERTRAALAYGAAIGERALAVSMILDARRARRAWLEDAAREWQHKYSRRPARNRHADTWSTREKYTRAHQRPDEEPPQAEQHRRDVTARERARREAQRCHATA